VARQEDPLGALAEMVLNHNLRAQGGRSRSYNHALYLPQKRAALTLWSEHVRSTARPGKHFAAAMQGEAGGA
jgi:hypothetical protein